MIPDDMSDLSFHFAQNYFIPWIMYGSSVTRGSTVHNSTIGKRGTSNYFIIGYFVFLLYKNNILILLCFKHYYQMNSVLIFPTRLIIK